MAIWGTVYYCFNHIIDNLAGDQTDEKTFASGLPDFLPFMCLVSCCYLLGIMAIVSFPRRQMDTLRQSNVAIFGKF